jgi:hypothetical protein
MGALTPDDKLDGVVVATLEMAKDIDCCLATLAASVTL